MKNLYKISAIALSLCATGAVAEVSFPGLDMTSVKDVIANASNKENVSEFSGKPSLEQLKAFASTQTRAEESTDSELPKGVVVETVLNKDFSDWTAGTPEAPDSENVADDQALYDKLLGADSGWTVFEAFQAGGNMYLGMDEVGDNGPGYFMTPEYDFTDPKVAYRFRVTAMNVNSNARDQALQVFFLNQNPGEEGGQMFAASTQPMKYNEWSVCQWEGRVPAQYKYARAMVLGWQGKVLIKNVTFEKIIYPLASVSDIKLSYESGKLTATWNAPEGATSYKASAYMVTEDETVEIGSTTSSEPSASFEIYLNENAIRYYVTVVALNEAGEESYPVSNYAEIKPDEVGDAVALDATDVSEKGFTANWEAISNAARTLVYPVQTHKATASQEYALLNEDFSNVPMDNDSYNPAMICPAMPAMTNTNMDLMMSRAGWNTDLCFFFRPAPEMPCLVLSNMLAAYGMPGYMLSPVYDLSVGGGNVFISGMAFSAADDVVLTFFLVDADTMERYASKDVEITTDLGFIDLTIEGGKPNSRIMFYMTDCAEEDQLAIPSLAISVDMNEGEEITAPLATEFVAAPTTSFDFTYPVDADNSYSYTVQGAFKELMGEVSEAIEVKAGQSGVATAVAGNGRAVLIGGALSVTNPDGEKVTVVSADGKVLASSSDRQLTLTVEPGAVFVRIGKKAFKFVR